MDDRPQRCGARRRVSVPAVSGLGETLFMNIENVKRYVALEKEKAEHEVRVKAINTELAVLEAQIVPDLIADGVDSAKVDGRTVYLARDVYAAPAEGYDREAVCGALVAAELGEYVAPNYNTNSIKSWVREVAREAEDLCQREERLFTEADVVAALPEALRHVLKVSFVRSLRSRKA